MNEKKSNQEGLITSLPQPTGSVDGAFTHQPLTEGAANHLKLVKGPDEGPQEFAIIAAHNQTGRVFSPFIVRATDEAAARKMCQRNYLVIQSVNRYVEEEGKEKPRSFPYGPPISDKDFERDYGNRPLDRSAGPVERKTPYILAILGMFFCGPAGAMVGWLFGKSLNDVGT